ncbi:hypothetical protein IW150_002550 [Coemansia sp. RSA 2607]|nr:hypothetical protein IW150_002550 [Coemansia sp. RSA 2607]KAJ2398086.1 hypothetical protein GGI05_000302 [Coemansia sp. RSA 2603]
MHIAAKPIRIAIAGGNFAGLSAVKSLYTHLLATDTYDGTSQAPPNPSIAITLIDRKDGFLHYLGMTRGLTQPSYGNSLWLPYASMPWLSHPSITVRQNIISRICPEHIELADSPDTVEFDYLLIALGQARRAPIGVAAATRDAHVRDLANYHREISAAQTIVVVGGGAVGTELAADLKTDFADKNITLVHSRELPVPGPFSDEFRRHVVDELQKLGVNLVLGERVVAQTTSAQGDSVVEPPSGRKYADVLPELVDAVGRNVTLTTDTGRTLHADLVFNTLGASSREPLVTLPVSAGRPPLFVADGLRVNSALQLDDPLYPHIFAAGDVASRDKVKLAGAAASAGRVAGANIARLVAARLNGLDAPLLDEAKKRGPGGKGPKSGPPSEFGHIKLVLGEHSAVIQQGDKVIPPEVAKTMCAPDIKLGKATKSMFIGSYPVDKRP